MVEVSFSLTVLARNGGSRFWPDWTGLEWRKLVLPTGMAWNRESQFWLYCTSLKWWESVLA
jgi:hypothetical protein